MQWYEAALLLLYQTAEELPNWATPSELQLPKGGTGEYTQDKFFQLCNDTIEELVIQSLNMLPPNLPIRIQTKKKSLNKEDSHQKAKTMPKGQLNNAQKHLPDIKSDVDTAMPYFMAVQTATI